MKSTIILLVLAGLALGGCDVTHPVAVVGPANTVYRETGMATFLEGGWFQVTNGPNSCPGRYSPASEKRIVTFPVSCTNGRIGVGKTTYENPRAGGGEIVMRDRTRWQFIFGNRAFSV